MMEETGTCMKLPVMKGEGWGEGQCVERASFCPSLTLFPEYRERGQKIFH